MSDHNDRKFFRRLTPERLAEICANVRARDCDAPAVPALPANDLELAILELLRQQELDRRAFYAPRGYGGPE